MEIYLDELIEQKSENCYEYFRYKNKIGEGSFGKVYHAIYLKNNKEVAVKIIEKDKTKRDFQKLKQEILILQEIKHPNIVEFYDYIETNNKFFIVMEYVKCGTLKQLISNKKEKGKQYI